MKSGSAEFGSVGAKFGSKTHTLTTAELPAHSHSATTTPTVWSESVGSNWDVRYGDGNRVYFQRWQALTTTIGSTGGGNSHNNIPPSMAALTVIKT